MPPTAPCPNRNSHPHSRRCSTIDTAMARRSFSVRARRNPLMGERGKANPMSNAKCSSTLHPATRPCAGSLMLATDVFIVLVLFYLANRVWSSGERFRLPKIGRKRYLDCGVTFSRIGVTHAVRSSVLERLSQAIPRLLPYRPLSRVVIKRAGLFPADQQEDRSPPQTAVGRFSDWRAD